MGAIFAWILSFISNPLVLQFGASFLTAFFRGKELNEHEISTLANLSVMLQKRGVKFNADFLEDDRRQKAEIVELWKKHKAEAEVKANQ